MKRAIVIVMDGCGAGAAPDAADYGDRPTDATIHNVWSSVGGFHTPTLERIGFLSACGIGQAKADCGRLRPLGKGKDSVTGHWEMMGATITEPFPTYPSGFPAELMRQFEARIGSPTLGNYPASGTAIIEALGAEHLRTGHPIVYTSADSVFQIATHEAIVPIKRLYGMCQIARELLVAPDNVQRVIARPFEGEAGAFRRTERRKDFPIPPPANLIDDIGDVVGVGVVPELFDGRGFRPTARTQSNDEHFGALMRAIEAKDSRLIFANFEDFDMLYGHRNNPSGFAACLEDFDRKLAQILDAVGPDDLLLITADHGNDPTSPSTDHSREYVPFVVYPPRRQAPPRDVDGMTAIGGTVAAYLGIASTAPSLLD